MLQVCDCRYLCCGCVHVGTYVGVCGCRYLHCRCVDVGTYVAGVWV